MPQTLPQKHSLAKEFSLYVAIVVLGVIALTGWYAWRAYTEESEQVIERMEIVSARIDRALSNSLEHSHYILEYILTQIHGKWEDLEYIDSLLSTLRVDREVNTVLSWNMFSWNDQYHRVSVNSLRRIIDPPIDVSGMTNMKNTMTEPGTLQLGKPVIGGISGQLVIPATMGAVNEDGHYIGAVGIGFNTEEIVRKLQVIVGINHLNFVVLDQDLDAVIRSPREKASDHEFIRYELRKQLLRSNYGILSQASLWGGEIGYVMYQKIANSPYTLLVSYDRSASNKELIYGIITKSLEFAVIGIVILLLLYIFYHRMISPITKLSEVAEKVSRGEQNVEIPEAGNYEVALLSQKLEQVVDYIEEIREVRDKLEMQSEELYHAKELAEKASNYKSSFLANMSHELRTPLGGIINFSDMMRTEMFGKLSKKYKSYSEDIYVAGSHLYELINDILDLSKAEVGKLEVEEQEIIVAKTLEKCVVFVQNDAFKKHLSIHLDVQKDLAPLWVDPKRFKQIIINILSNAVKFTEKKGTIDIVAKLDKKQDLVITVTDNGIGVANEDIPKILEDFGQVSSGMIRGAHQGTGLGLPITKKFVELHGGELYFESTLGVGTSVTVKFPGSRLLKEKKEQRGDDE